MKFPRVIYLAACLTIGLHAAPGEKQEEPKRAFSNLPEAARDDYQKTFAQAVDAYNNKKILSAIQHLKAADRIFDQDANLKFFLGLCHAELRNFDRADAYYDAALKLNPQHLGTLLNKAEAAFFNGQWEKAHKQLSEIRTTYPEKTATAGSLIDFKIALSASKLVDQGNKDYSKPYEEARLKYGVHDDTPFYFYAKALSEYRRGKKADGLAWVLKAYRVFADPGTLSVWDKVLIDAGYLHRHEVVVTPQSGS